MKIFFLLLSFVICFPAVAEPTAPMDVSSLSVYTHNKAENSRRAIRLGYQNFLARINTPAMTATDKEIVNCIQNDFYSFFEKLNNTPEWTEKSKGELPPDLNNELVQLLIRLTKLLLKNQSLYTNPLLLEDQAAVQETALIIDTALNNETEQED